MSESTGKQSRVLSARLHPSEEHEDKALKIWDHYRANGFSARQIFTDALLRLEHFTPEMFRRTERIDTVLDALDMRLEQFTPLTEINDKLDALAERFDESIAELLKNIRNADPEGFRAFAQSTETDSDGFELDQRFIENAQKAVRKTFKQRNQR